jgi:tetratricopeptide (TPR) repeat protein
LFTQFSEDKNIAKVLYQVARKATDANDAGDLYQYIVENHAEEDIALLAAANIGNILMRAGELDAAQETLDQLLTDFAGHPILPKAVAVMGDGYYTLALELQRQGFNAVAEWFFRKAITECQRVVTQLPETPYTTAECCYFGAFCHSRLGEYAEAIERYQTVVDNWPDYERAWSALFRVGRCYREMGQAGLMPKSQADSLTGAVYQQLLEEYPDCKMAGYAGRWLRRHHHEI